ncbi:histidine kinase dimerization/phospho-acceptor domain-containing protein [Lyngbya sp. PCC 8106]|uniref:histidine kinase dimerization/phospho-acceptor domain-containing protein n=1 Tax=Lyngbya sp. (strain PCC 8106) TaxID=313612 RepID=UPI0000EA9D1A|nr:histidine kinase dimerization/phospho-acceptor domain-containing protein [Lyngbya sp. PCC 8106]EAW38886.1 Multi-sensor Signal Transduction Histidine Kinase [Lyngbya sp. PCC 8106]
MNTSPLSPNHHQSFIAVVNHELRTPLTTILISAELLSRYNNSWSEEKKLEYIQRVQKAASQLTQLINSDEFANKLKDYAEQVQDSV